MRSTRKTLEQAVITAANEWRDAEALWHGPEFALAEDRLRVAVEDLRRHLEEITHAPGGFNPGSDTSEGAAIKQLSPGSVRRRIVDEVRSAAWFSELQGLTDDELERRMHRPHHTVSSARNWLVGAGWLTDSGYRRLTVSKREAIVWTLTSAAMGAIADPSWVTRGAS